jgi:FlaA1/EpsC-like NDP-sugar epimerase
MYRRVLVVASHLVLIAFSNYLAFLIRFEGNIPPEETVLFLQSLPLVMLVQFGCISYFGLNKGLWRYAGIGDLLNIIKAVSLSSMILVMIIHFFLGIHNYPRSVYIVDWLILTMFLGGIRMQRRLLRELVMLNAGSGKRVLLIGAGDAGEMILREIKQNIALPYLPIGFIDDDQLKQGLKIHGVPVLGSREDLQEIVKRHSVDEIIITIASASAGEMREIVEDSRKTGLPLKIIPGIGNILNGHVSVSEIREVRIEDLLYREVVTIDTDHIGAHLKDKKVMVTGAAGSIGSELCRQIAKYGPKDVILFDQSESGLFFAEIELKADHPGVSFIPIMGDIQDSNRLRETLSRWQPEIIFHSAAYKHVPLLEDNPSEGVKNNIIATRNLALIAQEALVEKFVLISTDKAVNPSSVMGTTKRVAEMYIQELAKQNKTQFVIVRFGNVLGSNGSVIPLFKMQIERKGPVTVTHPDVMRYFMTISEAVQLVLQASIMGIGGEIFVLDMGEQVKILDLARQMISLSGYVPDVDIPIVFTGLRPGEKLSEELFDCSEHVQMTKHPKIKMAINLHGNDLGVLSSQIDALERLIEFGGDEEILVQLRKIVSTYKVPLSPAVKRRSKTPNINVNQNFI